MRPIITGYARFWRKQELPEPRVRKGGVSSTQRKRARQGGQGPGLLSVSGSSRVRGWRPPRLQGTKLRPPGTSGHQAVPSCSLPPPPKMGTGVKRPGTRQAPRQVNSSPSQPRGGEDLEIPQRPGGEARGGLGGRRGRGCRLRWGERWGGSPERSPPLPGG